MRHVSCRYLRHGCRCSIKHYTFSSKNNCHLPQSFMGSPQSNATFLHQAKFGGGTAQVKT